MRYELDVAKKLLQQALAILPDQRENTVDQSWGWAWNELSSDAQEKVKRMRNRIGEFLWGENVFDLPPK